MPSCLELQPALEQLIDSFTEGLIEKDQFTSRMARTKSRIAELDRKIKDDAGDVDRLEHLRRAVFVSSPQPSGRTLQIRTGIAVET